ncbi:hypothetical protein LL033_15945 [Clostridium estertheticum]|uniref:hypothetical protein n=1 Tax=Clostridium estertheticum TaxID=238834 RepID=UPI001C0A9A29|nr:hypothetical protein [Clostridium estertheticum]MBU3215884.1 hypothetical protein [Clostridium estertheticum]WAG54128.1 hypothetical protein LL033_15945 [Clostridium estertheticum]
MDLNEEKLKRQEEKKTNEDKNTVLINTSNLLLRDERHEFVLAIIFTIGVLVSLIFYDIKTVIIFVICWLILWFMAIQFNFTPMSPRIKYICPVCKRKLFYGIDYKGKDEQKMKGYIATDCPKCKKHLKLIVNEKVMKHF